MRAITTLAIVLLSATGTWAQSFQGSLRGAVKDAQGVIPGAEVFLINEATNASRSVMSNEVGEFAFTNILPGTYTVRVSLVGFKTEERRGFTIGTQQQLVLDFQMEVGAISEQVTVTGEAPLVERASATVATTMRAADIAALPIFGRNTFYSAISTPNVIQSGDPQFVRYQDQSNASLLSLGGGPRRGNAYLLEGVSITDFVNRASWVPSTEAIEDMRVQVKTYDAEMGRAAGGVFNVTAKFGSNDWRGSALFITKPGATTGQLFFAKRAGIENPPQYYYSWAGSVGGPIMKNKTFFWFSKDDYKQRSTRNNVLTFPTALERAGNFSQTRNAAGQLVVVYDPLTTRTVNGAVVRDPFPGNIIPANRLNPIALAMLGDMPTPQSGRSFTGSASLDDGPQNQQTLKVDHRWSDRMTTTGMYGRQYTSEPGSAFWGDHFTIPGDPGGSLLLRTIDFYAVNQIWVPNNTTAVTVRYGYNRFKDDGSNFIDFDAATLGYPSNFTSLLSPNAFPSITIAGYSNIGHGGQSITTHVGQTANATVSRFLGKHSLKLGADYRRIEARTQPASNGTFGFTAAYTQANPNTASSTAGDAFASFLLGYPATGDMNVTTPGAYFLDYYSGYVQDDFRVSSKLTLNFGVRYEYEPGIGARNNEFTVGFDRTALFPVQVAGMELRGGLMYAGQNGYNTKQAKPLNGAAPRGGFAWSVTDKTVIRGGYGFFWVPTIATGTGESAIGARGYSASTTFLASTDSGFTPTGTLTNPYPNGITPPQGNSLGLATGGGSVIDFVDQDSKPGYVQQYSLDYQRELPGGSVFAVGFMGSRSERLGLGGTSDTTLNINQLDPSYLPLGTALQAQVANPFFGNAAFGNLSRSATIARGQLLRPYPQFDNVLMHRVQEASSRYKALVTRWNKRMGASGYSLDINYTWSRLEDNQFGESNSFSNRQGNALDNYDLDREFGVSLLDVAHRLNFSVTQRLPWDFQVTATGRYQTGFPLNISQQVNNSNLLGSNQRPNLVPGVEVMTSGSQEERAVSGWINPAAFTAAPAFTFGDVPRTNPEWRGPGQRNVDMAISKMLRFGGRTLSLRVDIQNVFDEPLFNGPVSTFGASNFGQITSVGGFARALQFQVRAGW